MRGWGFALAALLAGSGCTPTSVYTPGPGAPPDATPNDVHSLDIGPDDTGRARDARARDTGPSRDASGLDPTLGWSLDDEDRLVLPASECLRADVEGVRNYCLCPDQAGARCCLDGAEYQCEVDWFKARDSGCADHPSCDEEDARLILDDCRYYCTDGSCGPFTWFCTDA